MSHHHGPHCGCPRCREQIMYPIKHNKVDAFSENVVEHIHPSHTSVVNHHLTKNKHVYPHSTSFHNTCNSVDMHGGPFEVPGPGAVGGAMSPGYGPGAVGGAMSPGYGPGAVGGAMSPGCGPGTVGGAMSPGCGPGHVAGSMHNPSYGNMKHGHHDMHKPHHGGHVHGGHHNGKFYDHHGMHKHWNKGC